MDGLQKKLCSFNPLREITLMQLILNIKMASGFNFSSTNVNQHVFGNVGTTSSGTSFGGFGTGFGTSSNPVSTGFSFGQTTQQSRFVFGTPATTTSSKLGFAFGVPASSGISTFNFASTTTGSTGFSFGATSTAPAFGGIIRFYDVSYFPLIQIFLVVRL